MKSAFIGLLLLLVALLPPPALAANKACYQTEQQQAEQWLRLHSELMVITVTCRQGADGQDLPASYGSFTKKNLSSLRQAEQTMLAFYKTTGKVDAVSKLDRLRTLLGNEIGQKVADMSAPEFCAIYRNKVVQLSDDNPVTVAQKVAAMPLSEHAYAPLCSTASVASSRKGG